MKYLGLLCLALGLSLPAAGAGTWYVDDDRPDDSGDGASWASAKRTIQAAADLAVAGGGLVLVTNGVYREGGKADTDGITNRVYSANGVTIQAMSTNPWDTVIEGAPDPDTGGLGPKAVRGFKGPLYGGTAYLIGFTISNGYTWASGGMDFKDRRGGGANGGILSNCVVTGNAAIDGGGAGYLVAYNCIIQNNTAVTNGGGLYYSQAYACLISNNTAGAAGGGLNQCNAVGSEIVNNAAIAGGAMALNCSATNCIIRGNTASSYGAVAGYSQATWHRFHNCLIVENTGPYGAIYQRLGTAGNVGTLINCTMVSNRATTAGRCAGLVGLNGLNPGPYLITNSIIRYNWNIADDVESNYWLAATNSWVSHSCLAPDVTGQLFDMGGNNAADPLIAAGAGYCLQNISPCINAGTNQPWMDDAVDLLFNRRIDRIVRRVDMGCYEYMFPGSFFRVR